MKTAGIRMNQREILRRLIQNKITRKASPASNWLVAPNKGHRLSPPLPAFCMDQSAPGAGVAATENARTTASMVAACLF